MSEFTLNLNTASLKAIGTILDIDYKFVGTEDYLGLAYFWGHEYKHTLRDISIAKRRKIHKLGLERKIDFIKPNKKAWYLIAEVLRTDVNKFVDIEREALEEKANEKKSS